MSFNYENYLLQELHSDKVVVLNEQLFAKSGEFEPDKIYIVTKYLASSIEFGAETQPVQILILSEQNGLQEAKEIFESFTQTHNWRAGTFDGAFIKQQYSSPVVMSNFNEVAYGSRSVLYVSATLFIMENISDVEDLKIMGVNVKPLSFNWSYQMSGNTQPIGGDMIASTVKNMSTFQASLSIPVLNNYVLPHINGGNMTLPTSQNTYTVLTHVGYTITATIEGGTITNINQETGVITYSPDEVGTDIYVTLYWEYESNVNLLETLLTISNGTLTGNTDISITFTIFNVDFDYNCKLTSLQFTSLPNDVPTMQIGLIR